MVNVLDILLQAGVGFALFLYKYVLFVNCRLGTFYAPLLSLIVMVKLIIIFYVKMVKLSPGVDVKKNLFLCF